MSPKSATRVRLTHHVVALDDGHRVGVSVGGHGVPLVFLHGLGLSGRAYIRMLSRLAGMGFLVVALDAAGHGVTRDLPRNAADLAHRVDLTMRTLDALGVKQAVFMGHSMGGRMIVALAATAPDRVLAAILLDAAAGAPFDESIRMPIRSPRRAIRSLLGAAYDAHGDPLQLPAPERNRYLRMMSSTLARNVRTPLGLPAAFRAIVASGDYTPMLETMRERNVPTIVVHGEKDLVVPFDAAVDMAERADGALYRVPGAYHSWMLANPRHGADMMRQLLAAELGDALRASASDGCLTCWAEHLLTEDAMLRRLAAPVDTVGSEPPQHVSLDRLRAGPCRSARAPQRTSSPGRLRWRRRRRASVSFSVRRAGKRSPPPRRRGRCCAAAPR
ncbi:alpha/beta fold hydrolase [Mycobacterium deserti]|uniref:Alpha/beta hydrolase n=1 Tax=Mycobacterium deserti TaxID=2978347 RepID=A0ABT2M4V3_9MYCO|nr:alpha/beta hydrolase [Mycobacterium deserti]MCT7657287.1 alpha/beta hydrolase [Mycobacterium deserti]